MSKQKPEYYKLASGRYVALNRSAKRMFKKQVVDYMIPGQFINMKDFIKEKEKEKGLSDGNKKKKAK